MLTQSVHVVTIDESVIGYTPSQTVMNRSKEKSDYIHIVFVPRKPHPNGIECYISATYVDDFQSSKTPWILGIYPHLIPGDQSDSFKYLVEKCEFPSVHFIGDAWFSSFKNVDCIHKHSSFTLSCKSTFISDLWSCLSFQLPVNMWRGAVNKSGFVGSCRKGEGSEGKMDHFQKIL